MFTYVFAKVIMWLAYLVAVAGIIFLIITGFQGQHPKTRNSNRQNGLGASQALANKSKATTKTTSEKSSTTSSNSINNKKTSSSTSSSRSSVLANTGPGSGEIVAFFIATVLATVFHYRYADRKL